MAWIVLKAVALALVTIGISLAIPQGLAAIFFAILLAFAAGVYVGFAILDETQKHEFSLQVMFAFFCVSLAFLGVWAWPPFIAIGWAMHGLWDLLHHFQQLKTHLTH